MKNIIIILLLLIVFNSGICAEKQTESSQKSGMNVELKIHTLPAGGGKMSGNNYDVISSIGQLDATHITTGGDYQFIGGILVTTTNDVIFRNGFE